MREIGLGHSRASGGRLDDRYVLFDLAVAKRVKEQGSGQPIFQTARKMRTFIFQIDVQPLQLQNRQLEQMCIRRPACTRVDPGDGACNSLVHFTPVSVV